VATLLALGVPAQGHARSTGFDSGACLGCHGLGSFPIEVEATPATFEPGDTVELAVSIASTAGVHWGLYMEEASSLGSFEPRPADGVSLRGYGVSHTQPRPLGERFTVAWQAPAEPTGVRFVVTAVVGNGNALPSGDATSSANADFVFGCTSQTFYEDRDGDGFGRPGAPRELCAGAPPPGFGVAEDDCDDYRETVYPGAPELCNERDDDCDGEVDDDQVPVMQYPDGDRDGFYGLEEAQSDAAYLGCPEPGFASEPGDCAPENGAVYPNAEEVCNLLDDDCDTRVDEFVRPQCGVGWCRRNANTCDASDCEPGEPEPETCNFLDDDCDDELDEGMICGDGYVCERGTCEVAPTENESSGSGDTDASSGDDSAEGTGSTSQGSTTTAASTSQDTEPAGATSSPGQDADPPNGGCSCSPTAKPRDAKWIFLLALLGRRRSRTLAHGRRRCAPSDETGPHEGRGNPNSSRAL